MKNAMLIPVVTVTMFFFGFWIYFALPAWPVGDMATGTGALPWDVTMGSNFQDHIMGVFWAAFLLFSKNGQFNFYRKFRRCERSY